ncbi:MAG: hypothetical protein AAF480_10435 [Actinomycetota bacterium]
MTRLLPFLAALALIAAACGGGDDGAGREPVVSEPTPADDCLVRIHGRTDNGKQSELIGDTAELWPSGNDEFGNGRVWIYFPEDRYVEARDIVAAAIADNRCQRVMLNGFSNGGAMVASLVCNGEDFGGTLVGAVIDDPVSDAATEGCAPAAGVELALYWTGALDPGSAPGTDCEDNTYTCEGGVVIGIAAMAANLGVDVQPSPFDDHLWYLDAPEIEAFLAS